MGVLGMTPAGGDDRTLSDEVAGDGRGLIEQAARIVAQVENERLQLATGVIA
jgi:hypothetical protein